MMPAPELLVDDSCPLPPETDGAEAGLVRETLAGNVRAFDQIVRTHHRRIYQFLHQMTRQHQDAEDLTQQTFIKAFNHLAGFDGRRPLLNWLFTIARHNALNHFRAAKKWEEVPEHAAGTGPSPAQAAETRDRADGLWERARAVLSRREFEVLWLRFGEELSVKETASVIGLTQTHVKVLVWRARQTLLKGEPQS
jgi:RNA polymerase sigma-70 factor (ECF subfamily)